MLKRRDIAVWIILSILTCGIGSMFWLAFLVNDLNEADYLEGHQQLSGGIVILLTILTCGIYQIYWLYKAGERIERIKSEKGIYSSQNTGIVYLLFSIFGFQIVSYALLQDSLNKLADLGQ